VIGVKGISLVALFTGKKEKKWSSLSVEIYSYELALSYRIFTTQNISVTILLRNAGWFSKMK
jgi:hypothetical protein